MEHPENKAERLQKAMARKGIASRRHAENLISQGKVKVNGTVVTELGFKVSARDVIEVEGVPGAEGQAEKFVYILLHKPLGVISSVTDPRNRKTVIDVIAKDIKERVYPVGRLDYNTSGLLLLTNDGNLTFRLTHPSYGVDKTYRVLIKGTISAAALKTLQEGVLLADGLTSPAKILSVSSCKKGNNLTVVEISIHEGRNRQVRRMFEKVGHSVLELKRTAFGPIQLDDRLQPGEFRYLTKSEILSLQKAAGLMRGNGEKDLDQSED